LTRVQVNIRRKEWPYGVLITSGAARTDTAEKMIVAKATENFMMSVVVSESVLSVVDSGGFSLAFIQFSPSRWELLKTNNESSQWIRQPNDLTSLAAPFL
jgi:hypothetical protein